MNPSLYIVALLAFAGAWIVEFLASLAESAL
jgi:hypothetical protein